MPNIPSPISETSEESYFPPPSRRSAAAGAPNFSRPRPAPADSQTRLQPDYGDRSNVHTINAFHDANRDFPDEPRFSLDSEQTNSTSENSVASEFAWDGQTGELKAKKRPHTFDRQRVSMETSRSAKLGSSSARTPQPQPPIEMPVPSIASSSSSGKSSRRPNITKTVSFEQKSNRNSRTVEHQQEDTRSHHTVSDSGDSGSFDLEGNWSTSDYDFSNLSEAEIKKLKKKGISPALYAEMKAAKKGRSKWVGALSGNTFLS